MISENRKTRKCSQYLASGVFQFDKRRDAAAQVQQAARAWVHNSERGEQRGRSVVRKHSPRQHDQQRDYGIYDE